MRSGRSSIQKTFGYPSKEALAIITKRHASRQENNNINIGGPASMLARREMKPRRALARRQPPRIEKQGKPPRLRVARGAKRDEGLGPQREAPQRHGSRRGNTRRLVAHKSGRARVDGGKPDRTASFADRKLNNNGNCAF